MKKIILMICVLLPVLCGCNDNSINIFKEEDPCKQKVVFKGPCEMVCDGVHFDNNRKECVEVVGSCCEGLSPFKSLKTCQKQCQ